MRKSVDFREKVSEVVYIRRGTDTQQEISIALFAPNINLFHTPCSAVLNPLREKSEV